MRFLLSTLLRLALLCHLAVWTQPVVATFESTEECSHDETNSSELVLAERYQIKIAAPFKTRTGQDQKIKLYHHGVESLLTSPLSFRFLRPFNAIGTYLRP